jgi:adenine-specific DNA-methyltransferase
MANPTLEHLIKDFNTDGIIRFFRERSTKFAPKKESLDDYNDDSFKECIKLGEIKFDETEELIVCAFLCENPLSERSGKNSQYEKAKKILKERVSDAGIFVFIDKEDNFRFSLIYKNYLGQKIETSNFRRFTYFVSKEFTNKTFLKRIGDCDFTSLEKIKDAFSVEKVTKEFYENISHWYFWAVKNCTFPKDAEAEENGRNISVIRLITRMIFVWFMRERGLIPRELFAQDAINKLLRDSSDNSSSYYQAILQNLFFATLSTKQEEREFRSEIRGNEGFNTDHGNQYVYRFQDYFTDPEKLRSLFSLFLDIPFLNGGLFDCLDESQKGIYIDGFSETKKNQAVVPNFLFFGKEAKVDLSDDLGPQQKLCLIKGLLNILSEFNFTIDENTTDDKDVALDPELLGRVFENLLASFNPETRTSARKATGSYYTPREIVDYMVNESLKGYLQTHLTNIEKIEEKLSLLFSQETEENPFTLEESKQIVSLIESVRVVDPAVGSGAFPMGILNRLVFMLHKVDPNNNYWKQEQLNAAEQIPDPRIRKETKDRIETYFTKNDNYGRKLFLIQKCIYGVDIQQIAVEIAKLRFFISLLVDEDIDKNKPNWGIEPLPNLDFKIMQGNSLVSEFLGVNFEIKKDSLTGQNNFIFHDERSQLIRQFENKKIEYQNESDKSLKGKLLQEIDDAIIELFELIVKQQKESYFNSIE